MRRGGFAGWLGIYSPEAPDEPIIDPDTARLLDEIARRRRRQRLDQAVRQGIRVDRGLSPS